MAKQRTSVRQRAETEMILVQDSIDLLEIAVSNSQKQLEEKTNQLEKFKSNRRLLKRLLETDNNDKKPEQPEQEHQDV